jgi:RNA polymerase sigma-70 factor (ECF subfamily)
MRFDSTLAAARRGSRSDLGAILESCRGYMTAVANRRVPPQMQRRLRPSSVVQETYVRAFRHFEQFRGDSERQLLAWLRQILLRCLANQLRRGENRALPTELPKDVPARARSPHDLTALAELDSALADSLQRLPHRYRLVIELRHFDRLRFDVIGQILGVSAEAARKVWARAQARLGKELRAFE